jgi:hypothetical protein
MMLDLRVDVVDAHDVVVSEIHPVSQSFPFSTKYYCRSYLAFPLLLEESININSGTKHMAHIPRDVNQILITLDFALSRWITIII